MQGKPRFIATAALSLRQAIDRLSLRWKIYLSLAAILLPVFTLTIFIQSQLTTPLLEEEAREIGISVCRSLASDITSLHLMSKPDELESRLIEASWQQPSILRIDVLTRDSTPQAPTVVPTGPPPPSGLKVVATNLIGEEPLDVTSLSPDESPRSELRNPDEKGGYWEIIYPLHEKGHRKPIGWIHAEISLQLVHQLVGIFSRIAFLGALLAIGLLIWLLSYYLRRMIENERRLRKAESENIDLAQQLNEMQRQLFQSEKLAIMGQLTASFAHEIGTPLNSLSGHLQLLRDEVAETTPPKAAEHCQSRIGIINSQVSRIEGIVKDFLASTHTPPQQRQLVNVKELIERISKLVAPRLAAIRARASVSVPDNIEPLRIVPTDFEQILLNLTNNSIDALETGPEPRELYYEARRSQQGGKAVLEVIVRDTGAGIAPEALKQALKPFFTTKAPGQGTGLGLSICQRLVKRYGGKIELESALGKGTTVTVSFPYDAT